MIVGFQFIKIEAEKSNGISGKLNVNNNVTITEVNEKIITLGEQRQSAAGFVFEFTTNYEPQIGHIKLTGEIVYTASEQVVSELVAAWKSEKKVKKEIMATLLNTILTKSNIQALLLSQQVNLPSPIPLPKVSVATQGQEPAEQPVQPSAEAEEKEPKKKPRVKKE